MSSNPIIIKKLVPGGVGGGGIISSRSGPGTRIPGVFPSVRFGEHVVSTGIPSLDISLGGGVPLGTVLLIEDSFMSQYSDLILKCFLAEGGCYSHQIYIASGKVPSNQFVQELPSIKKDIVGTGQGSDDSSGRKEDEDMKIAWRYQQQQGQGSTTSISSSGLLKTQKKSSKFEFRKKSTIEDLGKANSIRPCKVTSSQIMTSDLTNLTSTISYLDILKEIASTLEEVKSKTGTTNLMRIGISHCEDHVLNPFFMNGLRALVRHTNSCAVITVSTLSSDLKLLKRTEQLSDVVISLQAILDEKQRNDLGGIDGLCKIMKLATVNALKLIQTSRELGFVFHRKQLLFQELHLPPEGENTVQREVSTKSSSRASQMEPSSSGCGSVKGKSIDF